MAREMITDDMWRRLQPLLPKQKRGDGRPRKDDRKVLEAILWVLRTGAPWRDIPSEWGPWETAYTRYSRWTKSGVWEQLLSILKNKLRRRVVYD